jgi:hypothetical protein
MPCRHLLPAAALAALTHLSLAPVVHGAPAVAAARAPGDYSAWTHGADLFLDTSPKGADVAGGVGAFPLLVRLDGSTFDFSEARRDGRDIRFSDAAGLPLPYQVDQWDSAAGRAALWVRLDTVEGNRADQKLRMHWGNPAAADSSRPDAVFDSADGFVAVWHLGGPGGERTNAVAGGKPASPMGYDGNENAKGHIGLCDSLDGEDGSGDHLALGDGYEALSGGFHFSVWAYPTAAVHRGKLLDLGNGAGLDNISIGRDGNTGGIVLDVFDASRRSAEIKSPGGFAEGEWQLIDVTVDGARARIYRNGALLREDTLTGRIPARRRAYNYLGRSNAGGDAYFRGRLDEARISRTARSADWIRLAHANQKSSQSLVSFTEPRVCVSRFEAPPDTALEEGRVLQLAAAADCASSWTWTAVSGPVPRLPDPDTKTLRLPLPRISGDTVLILRFSASYGDSLKEEEVRIEVLEAIPDPAFSLPGDRDWDGTDSLLVKPSITNLAAVKASRDSLIRWAWTLEGVEADTAWREGGLLIRSAGSTGTLKAGLCLDNGGRPQCRMMAIEVTGKTTPIRPHAAIRPVAARVPPSARRDAAGRLLPGGPGSAPRAPSSPNSPSFPGDARRLP